MNNNIMEATMFFGFLLLILILSAIGAYCRKLAAADTIGAVCLIICVIYWVIWFYALTVY